MRFSTAFQPGGGSTACIGCNEGRFSTLETLFGDVGKDVCVVVCDKSADAVAKLEGCSLEACANRSLSAGTLSAVTVSVLEVSA
jgi:hypothetical protein